MAEPLLSLLTPGSMKHVVPWKTREDFLSVYEDLYSDAVKSQESAIGRINAWKSRAGTKLSVAVESSANLMQVRMLHLERERTGTLRQIEQQLCSSYSLALIRFVNHVTEKAQTKAVAQPVHIVAREFGIPEWIVRLRHDATHSALPCLDTLALGAKWALDFLRCNFWEQQRSNSSAAQVSSGNDGASTHTGTPNNASPKTADIRRAFYEFQKIRYQRTESADNSKEENDHTAILGTLQKLLSQDKMKFIKCLLEDGILIATEEQLQAFRVHPADLMEALPPTVPRQMALFWRPLLKRMSNAGILPMFLHTAILAVSSDDGLRNYQLVAWIAFILTNTASSEVPGRGRRCRRGKSDCFMRTSQPIATNTLYSACIQNLNTLTAHLLSDLVAHDNVGSDVYGKLKEQLQVRCRDSDHRSSCGESDAEPEDSASSSSESDSDTVYTQKDRRSTDVDKERCTLSKIPPSLVEDIKKTVGQGHVTWNLCTDAVDWSLVPLGVLPNQVTDTPHEGHEDIGQSGDRGRRQRRRERRAHDDDEDEDEDTDDGETHTSPKHRKLIVTDELLI